jgi:hypothetical protein
MTICSKVSIVALYHKIVAFKTELASPDGNAIFKLKVMTPPTTAEPREEHPERDERASPSTSSG